MNKLFAFLSVIFLSCATANATDPLLIDGSNQMTGPLHVIHGSSSTPSIRFDSGGLNYDIYLASDPLLFDGYPYLWLGDFARMNYAGINYGSFIADLAPFNEEDEDPIDYKFVMDFGFHDSEGTYQGNLFGIEYGLDGVGDPTGSSLVGPVRNSDPVWAAGSVRFTKLTFHFGSHDTRSLSSPDPLACVSDHIGDENPNSMNTKMCWFAGGLYGTKLTQDIIIPDDSESTKPISNDSPTSSVVRITCGDPDGCVYIPDDPPQSQTLDLKIVNIGLYPVDLVETVGNFHVNGGEGLTLNTNDLAVCLYTGTDSTGLWSCR